MILDFRIIAWLIPTDDYLLWHEIKKYKTSKQEFQPDAKNYLFSQIQSV